MTRIIHSDGAEFGDVSFWSASNGCTAANTDPLPPSGDYYWKITGNSMYATCNLPAAKTEIYMRFRLSISAVTSATLKWPEIRTGTTLVADLRLNIGTQRIEATVNGSVVGTSTIALTADTWYLIEVYFKEADSGGRFSVKVDGNTEIDYTGDTKPSTGTTFDNIRFFSATGIDVCVDDLAINDTTGATDNSWLGDGRIASFAPTSDSSASWFASSGSVHYILVDDAPPDDDGSYVWISGSSYTVVDKYGCEDYDLTGTSIISVWTEVRAKKSSADSAILKLGLLPPGMLTDSLHSGSPLTTSYSRLTGARLTVNPHTSISWTESDVSGTILSMTPGESFAES